jgi:murein DD-endopeptidase MepM/ murein hydrolase activator NlpD
VVGTVLKGDLQSTIEDQLRQYADGLTSTAGRASSAIGDTWEDLQRAGRTSVQDVQAQLSDYATQAYNAAQEAQRQAAEQAAQRAEQAAQVQQELTAHANQVLAGGQQAGQPAALPHGEEPATATDSGQAAGASADDLGSRWKTQFDFGATYTGDYRTGTPHRGVDLVPSSGRGIGTEVDAFTPGTVTNIFRDSGAGGLIVYVQDADGLTHAYMHLAGTAPGLKVGDQVQRGTPIAMMGESGTEGSPHLHYEVRKNSASGDPLDQLIDPRPYETGAKQPGGGVAGAVATGATSLGTNVNRAVQQVSGRALPESAFEWKVNAGQSLSRDQVIQAGQQVGLSPEDAAYLYDSGVRNNIDAGSALAIIKLEGNARNPNNNIFDISNAAYGGRSVPGSRWGQYDSKQQGIDAYYQLLNREYIPNGQDTIGTIMHGPGSNASNSTGHAYAPVSENRPSYPQEVVDQVKQWGGQAFNAAQGAVAGARRAAGDVIQAGEQVAGAKPVIYNTPAGGSAMDQLQTIQSQLDALREQLAGAPEGARQAVTQAAEPLIAGAREQVGGAFNRLGTSLAGAGEAVAGAATRPLGETFPQLAGGPEQQAGTQQYQRDVVAAGEQMNQQAAQPLTPGGVAGAAWNAIVGATPSMGVTWDEYQQSMETKNRWLEENNPAKDVPLVGGLTTGIAQQLTDPLQVLAFGPTMGVGRALGEGVGETVAQRVGQAMSPAATRFVSTVASKLAGGALSNGVQNATFEAERPGATPESVGQAFWTGAALGSALDVGSAGLAPVLRGICRQIIDRAPDLAPILRARQRGEVDLGLVTTGQPTPREAPAVGVTRPEPEPSTRMYHGTGAEFESPEPGRFQEGGLFGPGYYLTSDPRVAGGVVARGGEEIPGVARVFSAASQRGPNGELLPVNRTTYEPGVVQRPGYAQERAVQEGLAPEQKADLQRRVDSGKAALANNPSPELRAYVERDMAEAQARLDSEMRGTGANVRAVDVPQGLKLFDADAPVSPADARRISGRQGGEIQLPFATNIAGAAFGGAAGNLATPENATPEERARNIAAGAAAGFGGTHLLTRGLLRGAETAPARAAEGFRAPVRPETPELRATTQEPPGGPVRPEGPAPRTLGEVRSNPYALREAASGETPMSPDEMLSYGDELEQRMGQAQARRDAVDELIRNPRAKIERPPWAGNMSNLQVAEIARRQGFSPSEPLWWEKAGLESGSGEVREAVSEGGAFTEAQRQRELTPAELRAERGRIDREIGNIQSAYEQLANAPAEPNLVRVRPGERPTAADLPFDTGAPPEPEAAPIGEAGGSLEEGARLAQEIVLSKNRGTLRSDGGTVSGEVGNVRATALVSHEAVQQATERPPSARTEANMPNLDAMLKGEPEIAAQIRKAAEDNPDLMEAYRQGRISMDSLRNDLAKRVGMTVQDWNKTRIGQGFNQDEMVALQAAAVEQQGRLQDLGRDIIAKGGVDSLSPEELVFSAATLADATKILAVARGARSTAGRTLNALKQRFDRTMASGITLANEQLAARRTAQQARRAATRATAVLAKGRQLEREATTAKAEAVRQNAPRNIVDQIAAAYDELDRYNAMTLHEKASVQDALKAERAKRVADRKARVRGAPEELLSALRAELKAEQDNFAKRRETWEDMAFWDTKEFENRMAKRTAFRGQLYIEQQRKVANIAAKDAEKTAAREFDTRLEEGQRQRAKAERLLEEIGGKEVTRDILDNFVKAMADPSPDAAAKFLKGMAKQSNWARANIIRVAGLVSGPLTNMVNIGGNVGNAMIEVPTRALTVGIDALRSAVTGGERQAYRAELLPMMQAYGPGMLGSLPNVVRALKTGINPLEAADLSKVRAGFASGNEVVDAAVEMPLRLLTAEDIAFRSAAVSAHSMRVGTREAIREGFRGQAAKNRAANIVQNLEEYPELAKEVYDAAARMVFQEKRALPLPQTVQKATQPVQEAGRLAVSQVAPFIRTPTNITAQGIAMSPIGFGGALEAARGVRELPVGTRTERYARGRQVLLAEERAARAIIGTTVLGAGVALGAAGLLTAAYPEDEQARSALPQGWRPWSMKVTNPVDKNTYYVPLQNFGAAGVPMAMAAIATDPVHRGRTLLSPEEWGLAVTGMGKYVLDNTFLQGLSDFVDALQDPAARGGKFGESLVASYGPYSGLARETQRAFGVAARNPHEGLMGLVEAMEANYPGLSGNVPPSRMPLGDERTQAATGASRLLPLRYDIERDEPTLKILRSTGVGIPKPPKAIGLRGGSIELTEDERAQLQQMRGQAIRDMVPRVSQNPAAVQKAVDLATASATRAFLAQMGADDVRKRWTARQAPEPYYLGTAEAAS